MRRWAWLGVALAVLCASGAEEVTVTGRAVETLGQPVAGVTITLQPTPYVAPGSRFDPEVMRHVPAGGLPDTLTGVVDVGELRLLLLNGRVAGKVVDAAGRPVARARGAVGSRVAPAELERLVRRFQGEDQAVVERAQAALAGPALGPIDVDATFCYGWVCPNQGRLRLEQAVGQMVGERGRSAGQVARTYLPYDFDQALANLRLALAPGGPANERVWRVVDALQPVAVWAALSPAERRVAGLDTLRVPDCSTPFEQPERW